MPSSEFILICNCSGRNTSALSLLLLPTTAAGGGMTRSRALVVAFWDVTANHSTAWTTGGCAPGPAHTPHRTAGSELHPFSLCAAPLSPGGQGGTSLPHLTALLCSPLCTRNPIPNYLLLSRGTCVNPRGSYPGQAAAITL